jgi:hypothetical protein
MGNWDRMKFYISDYLENSLDPTMQKEFEKALESSPELRSQLQKVSALKFRLNNLSQYQCSSDFSLKLRERIHRSPQSVLSRPSILRYSFAASLVIILAISIVFIYNSSDVQESVPVVKSGTEFQTDQSNPASNPVSGNKVNSFISDEEMDIKTKSSQKTLADSTRSYLPGSESRENSRVKIVDQKE